MMSWPGLDYRGSTGFRAHPVIISMVPECIIGMDIFDHWKNSIISSLDCVVRDFIMNETNGGL